MPSDTPTLLEWSEENLSKAISDLYKDAESDPALHGRLLSDPFGALSSRINIPEEYRGGTFAREKNLKTILLYVPASGVKSEAMPEGTAEEQQADYEITCTTITQW